VAAAAPAKPNFKTSRLASFMGVLRSVEVLSWESAVPFVGYYYDDGVSALTQVKSGRNARKIPSGGPAKTTDEP